MLHSARKVVHAARPSRSERRPMSDSSTKFASRVWRPDPGRLLRPPANILIVASAGVVSLTGWAVVAGHTASFDERAVRMLRRADDLAVPVGPAWLREAALDVTALGSVVVVLAVAAAVAGFLLTR